MATTRKAKVYLQIAEGNSPGTGWRYDAHVVNATNKRPTSPKPGAVVVPVEVEIPAEYWGYLQQPLLVVVPEPNQPSVKQDGPASGTLG